VPKVILRKSNRERRKLRVKKKVFGTSDRPRLSVFRSNKYSYGQIIDDSKGKTLVGLSLKDIRNMHKSKTKRDASLELGKKIAEKALKKKIKKVIFDRSGYRYHGRVEQIADGAREGGLEL